MAKSKNVKGKGPREASTYRHPEADSPLRPDVGTQPQFKKRKLPVTYRYDSSLSPDLSWDGQNHMREAGEALIREVLEAKSLEGAKQAAERLKAMSGPFLNWSGKAERLSFDVPTLPLFVHERLSTKGIIETLKGHKLDPQLGLNLFGDPGRSITDQVLKAYEYRDKWVNRMILGDSLVVMNSLLHYEKLGGQVQMIYIDPPYGVNFGSNFQPFVRKRDVRHSDDDDMTREPEMVRAYRDTWELGLHSYLSYLRDRFLLARDLLTPSGSIFVQISDENLHHVREAMEEVFTAKNFIALIAFRKRTSATADYLGQVNDFLLWYAKDYSSLKYRAVFRVKIAGGEAAEHYLWAEDPNNGKLARLDEGENVDDLLRRGFRFVASDSLMTAERSGNRQPFKFGGKEWDPGEKNNWKTSPEGLQRLAEANRIIVAGNTLRYKRYLNDFPAFPLTASWDDTTTFAQRIYSVQTVPKVIQRCIMMATDPGDLVLDPTCGSGTTAYVAEEWGRRWITIDTSRVPLALARQRLLTATFPYYQLADDARGPAGGFVYHRKQNQKGEEVGGVVPHVTLKSIANNEPPDEEVLVDRPEAINIITRVTGPFCVEATIPTPVDYDAAATSQGEGNEDHGSFVDRMLEVLRKSPVLQVGGNKKITLRNVRAPAKTLALSAEAAVINGTDKNVAFVFGPENGAVSEKVVHDAAFEAHGKGYCHLYVVGFAIQPNARNLIDNCEAVMNIPATYVQATPDLMMGDLLKTMRSSQIFSVCGLPEVKLRKIKKSTGGPSYEAELTGLDVFDPIAMHAHHEPGDNVPAWFLDTDYNGLCFHVSQAFFPRTSAWDSLKKVLRGTYDEAVWDHLAGTTSAPFEAGEHGQIAVKVIDDRGNELMVVQQIKGAD